ncbi:MAG: hypothetical protein HeimC2_00800 [Candidatus Heimdallarchaeota archaeon LC_2]|nr:MAG: hypothetical protein HeimC2_00800 [Candidatus Heimdallarchaeota archaeon LC_2]
MSKSAISQFQCQTCKEMRYHTVDVPDHENKISRSSNGLVVHSDIHRCSDGLLNIYNLEIDANYAIRSFTQLKLPEFRKALPQSVPGLPAPKIIHDEDRINFKITKMLQENGFRLVIYDDMANVSINIGEVNLKNELIISRLESDHGHIRIDYYYSELPFTSNVEKLLLVLINTLAVVPPTKIGLFIETLRYIHEIQTSPPSDFHIKLLKTILTTHETYFMLEDEENIEAVTDDLKYKYGDEMGNFAKELVNHLKDNPMATLQNFMTLESETHKNDDLIYVIHTFMLIEQTGLLLIDRPGIVND